MLLVSARPKDWICRTKRGNGRFGVIRDQHEINRLVNRTAGVFGDRIDRGVILGNGSFKWAETFDDVRRLFGKRKGVVKQCFTKNIDLYGIPASRI